MDLYINSMVSYSIVNGRWSLPRVFCDSFSDVSREILKIDLCVYDAHDELVWDGSDKGLLTLSQAYEEFRAKFHLSSRWKAIWKSFIPPKFSVLAWKIFYGKLPTENILQQKSFHLASVCRLCSCYSNYESVDHLFVQCDFANHLWSWLCSAFQTQLVLNVSIQSLWESFITKRFQSQVYNLWIVSCLQIFSIIWKCRNKIIFEQVNPSLSNALQIFKSSLHIFSKIVPGTGRSMRELQILKNLTVPAQLCKAPKILSVFWHPPIGSWIKVNTDGLSKGNPGLSACAGVFRTSRGEFIGGFSKPLGIRTSFYAECLAILILMAIEFAHSKGWNLVWVESDSFSAIQCFLNPCYHPPWELHTKWFNCRHFLKQMTVRFTHILREGNFVADQLVNIGFALGSYKWWVSPPSELSQSLNHDAWGFPRYRLI